MYITPLYPRIFNYMSPSSERLCFFLISMHVFNKLKCGYKYKKCSITSYNFLV